MSEHTDWITNDGKYQTQVYYTDDGSDPTGDHPTEWTIFRLSDGQQIATGWGRSPVDARKTVKAKLAELRSSRPATK